MVPLANRNIKIETILFNIITLTFKMKSVNQGFWGSKPTLIDVDDSFCKYDYESDAEALPKPEPTALPEPAIPAEVLTQRRYVKNDLFSFCYVTEYHSNGMIKLQKVIDMNTDLATGPFTEYYPDGTIYREGYLDNDLLQNSVKTYYPSGSLALYQEYDDGYLNGDSIIFYESGTIASHIKFRLLCATCDNKYKDYVSLLDGDYYEYFEDSTVKTHVIYNKGVIEKIVEHTSSSYIQPSTNYTITN
jgi:hypothetical protein